MVGGEAEEGGEVSATEKAWKIPALGVSVLFEGIVWGVPKEGDEGWIIYPLMRSFRTDPEHAVENFLIDIELDGGQLRPSKTYAPDSEQSLKRALRRARHRSLRYQEGWEYFHCLVTFPDANFETWQCGEVVRNWPVCRIEIGRVEI